MNFLNKTFLLLMLMAWGGLAYGQSLSSPNNINTVGGDTLIAPAYIYKAMANKTLKVNQMDSLAAVYLHKNPTDERFAKKYKRRMFLQRTRQVNGSCRTYDSLANHFFSVSTNTPICTNNTNTSGWQNIGPFIPNTQQGAGRVNAVRSIPNIDPTTPNAPAILFAGSMDGGLWKSDDNGWHWRCVTDDLRAPALGVMSISEPSGTVSGQRTMFIATGTNNAQQAAPYGSGIYKSIDDGETWQPSFTYSPAWGDVATKVLQHPNLPNVIYALIGKRLFVTIDTGSTWIKMLDFADYGAYAIEGIEDIEIITKAGKDIVYISAGGAYVYNTNFTAGWWKKTLFRLERLSNTTTAVAFVPVDINGVSNSIYANISIETAISSPNHLYIIAETPPYELFAGVQTHKFYKLDAINDIWDTNIITSAVGLGGFKLNQTNPNIMYFPGNQTYKGVVVNNIINKVEISGYGLRKLLYGTPHADTRDLFIEYSSADGLTDHVITGNDGSIQRHITSGIPGNVIDATHSTGWQLLDNNHGLNPIGTPLIVTEIYDMSIASNGRKIIGTQDNGAYVYDGIDWGSGGFDHCDGGQSVIDYSNPDIIYSNCNGTVLSSSNGGLDFSGAAWGMPGNGPSDMLMRQDTKTPSIMHFAKTTTYNQVQYDAQVSSLNVLKTVTSWPLYDLSQINALPKYNTGNHFNTIMGIAIAQSDANTIYIGGGNIGWTDGIPRPPLFKSTDGGNSWAIFKTFWFAPTSVAVNTKDPNKVWVGFDAFSEGASGQGTNRVSYFDGTTWQDRSSGLPPLPINTLVYQEGSDDILYAGTDAGIYRYNKDTEAWECFNKGIPISIISDIEIDYCSKKMYVATYGKGVWQADLPDSPAEQITTNTTIALGAIKNVAEDVFVKAGTTLTVLGTINIAKGKRIIVEPNAKLIIDGGVLTNKCGDNWSGIVVEGKTAFPQTPTNQGIVEIKNNAVIEYAYDAVTLGRFYDWGYDMNSAGGIVQAENAVFRNNSRDAAFMQYKNLPTPNSPTENANLSYFKKCTFETTDTYRQVSGVALNPHITMWDVYGVAIEGCTLQNTVPSTSITNADLFRQGRGIYTEGACYAVNWSCPNGDCTTPSSNIRTVFKGMERGIESIYLPSQTLVASDNHDIIIKNSDFGTNNTTNPALTYGIKLTALNHEQIVGNNFYVGSTVDATAPIPYGLYLDNCVSGFMVENNTFTSPHTSNINPTVGFVVLNSATASNEIYRNTFTNLTVGTEPIGNNRAALAQGDGLQIRCNTYTQNATDVYVYADPNGAAQGIALNQGNDNGSSDPSIRSKALAGNLFSLAGGNFTDYNNTLNGINYFHHTTVLSPVAIEPMSINGVTKRTPFASTPYIAAEACPDRQPALAACADPLACRAVNWAIRTDALTQIALHQGILNNLKDGGNTPIMLNEIDFAQLQDAYALYTELMQKSPYLSEEILKALAEKQNFPESMLRDIMIANSHAAKYAEVLEKLEERPTLPEYMLDQIKAAAENGVSAKEYLEARIAAQQIRFTNAVKAHLLDLRSDANATNTDFITVLDGIKQPTYRYQYINYLLASGQTAAAQTALSGIANYCNINEKEAEIYTDYPALYSVLFALKEGNRSIESLSPAEKSSLKVIAGNGNNAQAIAKCILQHSGTMQAAAGEAIGSLISREGWGEAEPVYIPSTANLRKKQKAGKTSFVQNTLSVFPNPANDHTTLSYTLTALESDTRLEIIDAAGRLVSSQPIKTAQDQVVLNTSAWANGIYICRIASKGYTLFSQKLSVNR
jgi:Secretion system C-terminal sorting domain